MGFYVEGASKSCSTVLGTGLIWGAPRNHVTGKQLAKLKKIVIFDQVLQAHFSLLL